MRFLKQVNIILIRRPIVPDQRLIRALAVEIHEDWIESHRDSDAKRKTGAGPALAMMPTSMPYSSPPIPAIKSKNRV
jgi:hypothetical protein